MKTEQGSKNSQDKLFFSKIDDMRRRAEAGKIAASHFLTPEEVFKAQGYLEREKTFASYAFYGGYEDAERKMLIILPDYISAEYLDTDEFFRALFIKASGYAELTHRSYLGALMNLSIKREALGDIVVLPEGAIVFCTLAVAKMLAETPSVLDRVGRDKVSVSEADKALLMKAERKFESRSVIMASLRLDCAVASLSTLSRSKAQEKISGGLVMLNFSETTSVSAEISEGDIISIRGIGKFIIDRVGGETKSGRLKVDIRQYV